MDRKDEERLRWRKNTGKIVLERKSKGRMCLGGRIEEGCFLEEQRKFLVE